MGLIIMTLLVVGFELVWVGWWWVFVPLVWWYRHGESGLELMAFFCGLWIDAMQMSQLGLTSLVLVLTVTVWKFFRANSGGNEKWIVITAVVAMSGLSMVVGGVNVVGILVIGVVLTLLMRSDWRISRGGLRLMNDRV